MRSWQITLAALALLLASGVPRADAASLADIRDRGTFAMCAHPDALPYSSQDRVLPGFQIELGEAIAKQLGVKVRVDWIIYTRHARRMECDATIGSIVKDEEPGPRRGPRLTRPYMSSGYLLVIPAAAQPVAHLEDIKGGKIGVEHTSWPHFLLDSRKIPLASFGSSTDILDAIARGEVAAGLVSDAYVGWYMKLNPGAVKVSEPWVPEKDLRWNVAVGLRNADSALVEAVNKAIDTLTADKTLPTILGRYGITYRPPIVR